MKKIFGVILLLAGCSHGPEIQKNVVDLPFAPELVEQMQKASPFRVPANVEDVLAEGKSSRRVYFSALYHQMRTLGNHLNETSNLISCPQFHHDKLEVDSNIIPLFSIYKSKIVSNSKEFFPEFAFNKGFSIEDHYEAIKNEVGTLCEEGVSDNYFKFDNLITHYASKASFHKRPDSMKSILKIPVFANYYLIKMLQSPHGIVFVHPEERRVISMTQTHWFEKYVVEAQRMRSRLIKNHMVQR